jgi:hypothetical protein
MQTVHGGDTANLRYKALSSSSVTIYIEEEISNDEEVDHTTEVVGYLALSKREATETIGYIGLGDLMINQVYNWTELGMHIVQPFPIE